MSANWMTSRLCQQLGVRTVGQFLLAVLTMRGFVSTRHTDNNIYASDNEFSLTEFVDISKFSDVLMQCQLWTVVFFFGVRLNFNKLKTPDHEWELAFNTDTKNTTYRT